MIFQAETDLVHPPAFFLALAVRGQLAGREPAILRCFSLFAGMLVLALLSAGDSLWPGVYGWRSDAHLTPLDLAGEHNLVKTGRD